MIFNELERAAASEQTTGLPLLSLFTGAGGLDLGLEEAGFDVRLCVELDEECRQTLATNRPTWPLAEPGDIHELTPADVLSQAGLKQGDVTLLAGGPPCQPFSKSGYWVTGDSGRLRDPRSNTLLAYTAILEAALPEVLLLENVKGLVFSNKDEGFRLLEDELARINALHGTGYAASVLHLNAAHFGVPQFRERVFIVAHREGRRFAEPARTHWPADSEEHLVEGNEAYRTAWDAIGDLDSSDWQEELRLRGKWADLIPSIPEGQNYLWHTPRSTDGMPLFGWRTRYWSFLLKLAKNRPSWTIQAVPGPATGPFHWRNRHLSIKELSRLQTFPDDYVIQGGYRAAHKQIGNAVPPAIGELLGREIRRQILGHQVAAEPLHLIPDALGSCPPPESCVSVPRKYWNMKAEHADHPGPGLGPGALSRQSSEELYVG